ncbi:WEB family protein At2g38370 isoform X3 [Vigna radiata var. radiata]|uniref:WEB family protein At2g38370 isoform X3 n=1 Tax=Vigna radiata var. radiata TaxID=3916 RepID=A0A1S3TTC7_VIGRR|nr:WEB family protein At2g38370 isoform X3 [Vigna radiata var. radiata]
METGGADVAETTTNQGERSSEKKSLRTEVDTSAPFESVKDAVTMFGGIGYWKPLHSKTSTCVPSQSEQQHSAELSAEKLEEQASVLEKELILKERETLDVLKELESTKKLVEELKSKIQKEQSEVNLNVQLGECYRKSAVEENEEKENQMSQLNVLQPSRQDVRTSVESLNKKLEKERISLEKTRERLAQNTSKISSLEEELNHTRLRLQIAKGAEIKDASDDPSVITRELQRLSSEAENFKIMGESAKAEVLRTMSEIEQTKTMIRTAEIRLVAARKMKEAAKAAEAFALVEINALSNHENESLPGNQITLSFEEYTALTCKAHDAEEQSRKRVANAMLEVDETNLSNMDILKRVEEATEEVKTSKKALEEALERVEAANRDKVEVEEALRNWRSEGHKRRSIQNPTKFKTSCSSHHWRDPRLLDVNGLHLVNDEAKPVLKSTLSIGQILSRKLLQPQEFEAGERISMKQNVSLGQMLGKQNIDPPIDRQIEKGSGRKLFSTKRNKFGFARFSHILSKQQKNKKKPTLNLR